MSYNIGFTLFGGLASLIITYLVRSGYNSYLASLGEKHEVTNSAPRDDAQAYPSYAKLHME